MQGHLYAHSPFYCLFCATDGPVISCSCHYEVRTGERFTPNCTVEGFPQPEVVWYKNGMDIVQFPEYMSKSDAGQYTLIASNDHSNSSHTLEIDVLCKCTTFTICTNS